MLMCSYVQILEQVSNAQDIPETTQDLIQHANNCFKLLRIFYKVWTGRCVVVVVAAAVCFVCVLCVLCVCVRCASPFTF